MAQSRVFNGHNMLCIGLVEPNGLELKSEILSRSDCQSCIYQLTTMVYYALISLFNMVFLNIQR